MKLLKASIILTAILTLNSCAKIYHTDDAEYLAQTQETVAILPPSVSIQAQMFVDAESMKERQNTMSLNIQKEMHSWMLRRKMQGKIFQEFMDIETVNAKLKKAGYWAKVLASRNIS